MLSRKVPPMAEPVRLSEAHLPVGPVATEQPSLLDQVEVTSLRIAQDPDVDTDPYNCTGQHCVVDIVKDS